jgi:hypothetical protein
MLRFRLRNVVPPGGEYSFYVEDTDTVLYAATRQGLEAQARGHYRDNGLKFPSNFWEQAENYMCLRLPESFCSGHTSEARKRFVTLPAIRRATTDTVLGTPVVSAAELADRLRVCESCEHNDRRACPSCTGLTQWAVKTGKIPTHVHDQWVGICAIDTAAISAIARRGVPKITGVPGNCWRRLTDADG